MPVQHVKITHRPSENRKTTMTASMYILLLLALIFANAPFITTKFFGIVALKRKHIGHHLIELLAGFLLTAILAYILESRAGAVHAQDWEFYAPTQKFTLTAPIITINSPTKPEVAGRPALAIPNNIINAANLGITLTTPP